MPLHIPKSPTFTRFSILYAHLWSRERSSTGLITEVVFVISNAPVSGLGLFAESRLWQWLRSNTVDWFTLKPADGPDADAEAACNWQERDDVEIALRNYLDDLPSMSSTACCIHVSFHICSEHRVCLWTPGKRQIKNVVPYTPRKETV